MFRRKVLASEKHDFTDFHTEDASESQCKVLAIQRKKAHCLAYIQTFATNLMSEISPDGTNQDALYIPFKNVSHFWAQYDYDNRCLKLNADECGSYSTFLRAWKHIRL